MIEACISWILLIAGIISGSEMLFIASGIFAVACGLADIADALRKKVE